MKRLTIDYLKELHQVEDDICISMYMPTHKVGNEIRQDKIRYKNLLNEVTQSLKARSLRDGEIEHLLRPLENFRDEAPNWQNLSEGLVLFRSKNHFEVNQFPAEFDEQAVVSHRYHLKPLIPLLNGNGLYYLLSLSQNKVKLYEGTRYSMADIDDDFLPDSLVNALQIDEFIESQQFHSGGPVAGGGRAALFHGQGGGEEDQKVLIEQFFRQINKELTNFLDDRRVPLVLAGVEYLHPIYNDVNTHEGLLEKGVRGNPDSFSLDELHERSWKAVKNVFEQEEQQAVKQYEDLKSTGKTLSGVDEVVAAAVQGRIDTLFVSLNEHVWGRYAISENEIRLEHSGQTAEDLLDLAAVKTLFQSGKVFGMHRSEIPDGHQLAGIARF